MGFSRQIAKGNGRTYTLGIVFWLLSVIASSYLLHVFIYHGDKGSLISINHYSNFAYKNILLSTDTNYESQQTAFNSSFVKSKISQNIFIQHEKMLNRTLKSKKHPFNFFPMEPKNLLMNFPESIKQEHPFNFTKKNMKKILYWNDCYGSKFFGLGYGQIPFILADCEYQNCFATSNRKKFQRSEIDAVLWHFRAKDISLPKPRYPNAKYIFFMAESASYLFGNIGHFNNVFDYTYTYRSDSDIPAPYNIIARRKSPDKSFLTDNFTAKKTNLAIWFISNCAGISGRMEFGRKLKKYIQFDIYGKCGQLSCPRSTTSRCYEMAAEKYFFYLAFENSLCNDYITEKFFNVLHYNIVPVVYGAGPYWMHAPPYSYIDAFDFHSVKELADYMIHLSKSPTEYNDYFRWKTNYKVLPQFSRRFYTLCKICELLNTDGQKSNKTTNRYNLEDWFVRKSHCMTSYSPVIRSFLNGAKSNLTVNEYRKKMSLL